MEKLHEESYLGLYFYFRVGVGSGSFKIKCLVKDKKHRLCFTFYKRRDNVVIVTSNFDISTLEVTASDSVETLPFFSLC